MIQQAGLFPHRTVRDNIATVPQLLGWPQGPHPRRGWTSWPTCSSSTRACSGRYPAALSGGQQQRVGVARALAADPPVLLMDEPYSAVDPIVRARLQDELLDLQRRVHKTIVLVTHDIDEAIKLADRIAILNIGGVLEQVGSPAEDLLREPANDFVADFLGDDRGIKRLSLMTRGQAPLSRGPSCTPHAARRGPHRRWRQQGTDWVAVCDGDRLRGWVGAAELDGVATVADAEPGRSVRWCDPDTTLKAALDGIVTHAHPGGGGGATTTSRYLGMLTVDDLAEGITA